VRVRETRVRDKGEGEIHNYNLISSSKVHKRKFS
jgi:hypothetical protein